MHDISVSPDFTSLHVTPNGNMFLLTQFEASSPAGFYVTKLSQNKMTGELTAVHSKPTDWSAPELQGLWTPCAGSVTPWGSHAGGEEYEPDGERGRPRGSKTGQITSIFTGQTSDNYCSCAL